MIEPKLLPPQAVCPASGQECQVPQPIRQTCPVKHKQAKVASEATLLQPKEDAAMVATI